MVSTPMHINAEMKNLGLIWYNFERFQKILVNLKVTIKTSLITFKKKVKKNLKTNKMVYILEINER